MKRKPCVHGPSRRFSVNKHLAHIIEHIDPGSLNSLCDMDYTTPEILQFVIEDYVRHLQHHLNQIFTETQS